MRCNVVGLSGALQGGVLQQTFLKLALFCIMLSEKLLIRNFRTVQAPMADSKDKVRATLQTAGLHLAAGSHCEALKLCQGISCSPACEVFF